MPGKKKEFSQERFKQKLAEKISLKENKILSEYLEELEANSIFYVSDSELNFENLLTEKVKNIKSENKQNNKTNKIPADIKKIPSFLESTKAESSEKYSTAKSLCAFYEAFQEQKNYRTHTQKRRESIYHLLKNNDIAVSQKKKINNFLYNKQKIKPIVVKKIEDFSREISKLQEKNQNLFFRGQENLNWKIQPGIVRNNPEYEREYFAEILRRYPEEFKSESTYFEKLAKMQHFGIPTRLLDITENPYVALYFACESNFEDFGEVRIFKTEKENIKDFYDEKINEELEQILHKNQNNSVNTMNKSYIVNGKYSNRRILNQKGLFVLCRSSKKDFSAEEFAYKKNETEIIFVIPCNAKPQILESLAQIGITKDFIYPDIEHSAEYLKERFNKDSKGENA